MPPTTPSARPRRRHSTGCGRAGPHGFLHTSGKDVGLPDGQMGNSEVGHLNIGAGRVVMQDLPRIGDAIASGEIAKAPALLELIAKLKAERRHLSSHRAWFRRAACIRIRIMPRRWPRSSTDAGVPTLVHAFTDGRDTPPQSAGDDIKRLLAALPKSVPIATVCGRYYAMDRDKRWDRVEQGLRRDRRSRRPALSPMRRPSSPTPMPTRNSTSSSCRRWSATIAA